MAGLGSHYELVVTCRGEIDPIPGYLINIKEIDHAVRTHTIPLIHSAISSQAAESVAASSNSESAAPRATTPSIAASPVNLIPTLFRTLPLRGLHSLRWKLSPYYSLEVTADSPTTVLLRQKFDFCAAHRLHNSSLSLEENRKLFGKCNHPGGHGHNYQFEPCVALTLPTAPMSPSTPGTASSSHLLTSSPVHLFSLSDLEHLADSLIVQRFDHKNLNTDTEEFRDAAPGNPGGLNPSVENIAKVCFNLLAPALRGQNAKLQSVTVWESDRTSCTYPA